MKQPKKLTRDQKILVSGKGLDPRVYALHRELPNSLILANKYTGKILVLEKM